MRFIQSHIPQPKSLLIGMLLVFALFSLALISKNNYLPLFIITFLIFLKLFKSNPGSGIALMLTCSFWPNISSISLPSARVGPINVTSADAIAGALALVAIARSITGKSAYNYLCGTALLFWLFVGELMMNITRGTIEYKQSAVGEARPYFYIIATALYIVSFPADHILKKLLRISLYTSALLLILTSLRWAGVLPMPIESTIDPTEILEIRPINSAATLYLCLLFIALIPAWALKVPMSFYFRIANKVTLFLLLSFVLLLQHRSVWLTLLVGLFSTFILLRKQLTNIAFVSILSCLLLFSAIVPFRPTLVTNTAKRLSTRAEAAVKVEDTAKWRLIGWKSLLNDLTAEEYIIGAPFGSYFRSGETHHAPHSFYVRSLLRTGILGLVFFFLFLGTLLFKLAKLYGRTADISTRAATGALICILMGSLGYFVAYSPPAFYGMILGLTMRLVDHKSDLKMPMKASRT